MLKNTIYLKLLPQENNTSIKINLIEKSLSDSQINLQGKKTTHQQIFCQFENISKCAIYYFLKLKYKS